MPNNDDDDDVRSLCTNLIALSQLEHGDPIYKTNWDAGAPPLRIRGGFGPVKTSPWA